MFPLDTFSNKKIGVVKICFQLKPVINYHIILVLMDWQFETS